MEGRGDGSGPGRKGRRSGEAVLARVLAVLALARKSNWIAPHHPAAVTNFRGWLEVRLFRGGQRPPSPDNMGRGGWRKSLGEDKNKDQLK